MESHEALACALFCVAGRALLIAMDSAGQCLTDLHSHLCAAQRSSQLAVHQVLPMKSVRRPLLSVPLGICRGSWAV